MRAFGFHRGVAAVLSLTLAATSVPSLALAEDAPAAPAAAPTPEQLEEARANFKAGLQLEKEGKYDEALPIFEAVAAVKASAQVKFHIGLCNEKLGRMAAAAAAYESAAEQAKKDGNAPEVLKVAPDLARKIRDRLPVITFGFVGDVYPDTLTIDGKPVDLKGNLKELPIDPGTHVIVAVKGDEEKRSEIKIVEGDRKILRFKLGSGGGENASFTDSAERVAEKPKVADKPAPTSKLATVGWVVTGVGVASLGASLVFLGLRARKVNDLNDACDGYRCPSSAQSTIDSAKSMTTLSRVTLGVGAGAVVGGIVMIVLGSNKKTETTESPKYLSFVPYAPNTQVGFGFEGAF